MFKFFFWIFFEKGFVTVLQFFTLIVLGHILSPIDYGVYGTMMVFIAISEMLIDSGFGGAIIQKSEITKEDINTLFFINVLISICIYCVFFLFAPFIEHFYNISNLALYFRIISITLIVYALSIVQNALLIRSMQFKKSTIINCSATVLSSIIAIALALANYGVWALVFQLLSNALLMTLLLWINNRIKLEFKFSKNSFLYLWKFGSNLVAGNILQTIINNITTSIIPKIADVRSAGFYFQSSKITNIPVNILSLSIDKGLFPILSKEQSISTICSKARPLNRIFITFFMPLFPLLSVSSAPLINILLGPNWLPASDYFAILIWSGIALMMQGIFRNIVKSIGDTRIIFKVELIKGLISLFILLISIKYGVLFLIYGFVLTSFIGVFVWSYIMTTRYTYKYYEQFTDIYKPMLCSIIIYLLCLILSPSPFSFWNILLSICGYIVYLLLGALIGINEIKIFYSKIFGLNQ